MAEERQAARQQIDPVFKQIVEEEFAAYGAICQTQYEVGRLPRTIDALVTVESAEARKRIRAETPFFYFLQRQPAGIQGT